MDMVGGCGDVLLGGFFFFVEGIFSPVDHLFFFPLDSGAGLIVGLWMLVGDCPISTVN